MLSKHLLNFNIFFKLKILLRDYTFSAQNINSLQLKKLKRLLIYTYNHFEFYKVLFDKLKFDPYAIKRIQDIQKLPVMDKESYREFSYSLVKKNPDFYKKYYRDGTSGTTGKPLTIYRTWNERAYMLAKYLRSLFLNGYRYRDITFCLPSPHRITESDSILQKFGLLRRECISYTEPVDKMVEGYQKSQADFLYANKSQLIQMAQYIRNNNITIKKPRMINSSGELLDSNSKNIIESIFGNDRIFEVYGAVEFGNLAFQILGDKNFHFNHDTNLIELDNNGKIDKTKGRCIITDLHIFSFPLIRYKLDDWIEMEDKGGLRIITKILGRNDDWVTLKDGSRIPFHHFYEVMENKSMVRQFKFIQENINLIKVYVILDRSADKKGFEKLLLSDLKMKISDSIDYEIIYPDQMPPDPAGKLRMVISKI